MSRACVFAIWIIGSAFVPAYAGVDVDGIAQNGRGIKLAAQRGSEFPSCVAVRIPSLCAPTLPPALKGALERFAQQESGFQARRRSPVSSAPLTLVRPRPIDSAKVCSIPLTKVEVPHPERFSIKALPAPAVPDHMAHPAPAPACK